MKKQTMLCMLIITEALLVGCSSTAMNAQERNQVALSSSYQAVSPQQVVVYKSRAEIPQNGRLLGKVTAQNYDSAGISVSKTAILLELKKQAIMMGGNGIVHITPGTAQTTANAVLVK